MISRFNPAVWIVAVSDDAAVCQGLAFSYGVYANPIAEYPKDWRAFAHGWLREHGLPDTGAFLVAGPSASNPDANHRIEFMAPSREG
jgi:pyruvate kinase